MAFIINNILFVVLVGISFLFVVLFVRKIYREIRFNQALRLKHLGMRIQGDKTSVFTTRIGLMTGLALAPVLVVALVLGVSASNTRNLNQVTLSKISGSSDIIDLHNDFSQRMDSFESFGFDFFVMNESVDTVPERSGSDDITTDFGMTPSVGDSPTEGLNNKGGSEYSDVNKQVSGVDELDNAITDGKYIYTIENQKIVVSLAYTVSDTYNALSVYDKLALPDVDENTMIEGLYIDNEYLVAIVSYGKYDQEYDYIYGYDLNATVGVYVFNMQNDFAYINHYELSGNFLGTRKINDNVFVITTNYIPFTDDDLNVDEYLPYYLTDEKTSVLYEDIVYLQGTNPNSFTSFYAVDIAEENVDMEVVLGDNSYSLYVSEDNMYLVGTVYQFEPLSDLLDFQDPVAESKTAVMKINIDDSDLTYQTTGFIEGYALNQFSMDEYDGNLRIVTTSVETQFQTRNMISSWTRETINRLYILDENLEIISVIGHEQDEKLGKPGETVQSSRCIQDYCYVVTFEQTDPFYVVDVSDTAKPSIVGALEIPGFSSYLQPLNNDYVLGIGFGDNSGGTNGLKVAIYDIKDKTNPSIYDEFVLANGEYGYGWSSATYNHKDLLVSISKGIIGLPYESYGYNNDDGYSSGILLFSLNDSLGFETSYYITHSDDSDNYTYVYKALFIDNYLYTVSDDYIKVSSLNSPSTILKTIDLTK